LVSTHHITHVLCLPSVYRLWLEQTQPAELQTLEHVIVAGEACDADLCSMHYQKLPDTVLYNEYGPTEACVWSSVHRCRAEESVVVPIGQPIPGTTIKVVGIDGTVCPDGVEGELQLFGGGVAGGYYNRPELTAQHFSSDPASYKSGDLGYRARSGELFCTGRVDRQLKIRGQRIEPAEIEAVARRAEEVSDVRAFVVKDDSAGLKRLWLAYAPKELPSEQLKSALETRLPTSMWPHGYLALESLPKLSNGKVSELKLIELLPQGTPIEQHSQIGHVENAIDTELLEKVNGILGEQKATLFNSASQCGLDSIDAMKLTAQLRERFDIDLRLASVLESRHWGDLASHIRELLDDNGLSSTHQTDATEPENIPSQHIPSQHIPLSAQQLPLWFLDQTGLEPAVYAVHSSLHCTGKLSLPAIEYALNALVHQHEILRTRLRLNDTGDACQVVLAAQAVEITTIEQADSDLTWEQARDTQLNKRFDLANDQLLRALVYRCAGDEYYLLFHSHHSAMDGWSFDLLHTQYAEYYCRFHDADVKAGKRADSKVLLSMPKPDEYQYRDFTLWQKNIAPKALISDTEHWCKVLAAPRETLELPYDKSRPARPSFAGGSVIVSIDPHIIEQWAKLAQSTQATPFMVALAAVKTGLRSVLGANDLLIGTPVSNRVEPRWQNMLGFFGNTVVVRTKNHQHDSLADCVQQTRLATLDALRHETLPFDHIVRTLGLQGASNRNPLFDVFFMYKHENQILQSLPGVDVEPLAQRKLDTAKFDLAIEIRPSTKNDEQGYELHLNYGIDLFRTATIENLAQQLHAVMSATAHQPDIPLEQTLQSGRPMAYSALLSMQENSSAMTDGANMLVNQRLDQVFAQQCLNRPDSLALQHNEHTIHFAALDQLVKNIAQCLRKSGVIPGEVVAVSLPRSIHQIAAALAISSCEAVWCPVDPAYPLARKRYMCNDSGARFLISDASGGFDKAFQTPMLHISLNPEQDATEVTVNSVSLDKNELPTIDAAAARYRHEQSTAVLMYTSGSTGNPKGVLIGHRAIMNRFIWMWNRYPFAGDDVNSIKTSCSFVDSLWESFGALLTGTPSVLIDDADVTDIERFLTALRTNNVTRVLVVPSLLTSMLDWLSAYDQQLPGIRLCSCSGEVLPTALATRFLSNQTHARLLNLYGSTEVTADVTCQEIVLTNDSENLPLGAAIDGVSVHILDEQLHVAEPPGTVGEIAFAGTGLAIGYHADKELTTQKFVELQGIGRVFLTGDTGHVDPLGRLHFDGRKDRQVKIRGIRVNCHEIEQQINSLSSVAQSLVFAQGELDERHLCALVQQNNDVESFDETVLANRMQTMLPVHQLPDRYRLVTALPLLPNGKPDRVAAAALMHEPTERAQTKLPCQNVTKVDTVGDSTKQLDDSTESNNQAAHQLLAAPMLSIWQDTLNNHSLSVDDDFFAAGGYSLLAVKLVMRVNKEVLEQHNLQMTIGDILEKRTVSNIVDQQGLILNQSESAVINASTDSVMTLQTGTGSQQLFMVPPFGDTGFFFRKLVSVIPEPISVYSFDMAISVEHETLESLCSALVDEILVVQPKGPWVILAGCLGNILALEMSQQLKSRTGKESDLYLIDSNPPREGPGWKHKRERKKGVSRYWSIIRKEYNRDYFRNFVRQKLRRITAVFDKGIRKYLNVRLAQSDQFVKYKGRVGSANITLFRSSTFMKRPYIVERWSLLTTGKFNLRDFPKISHEKLLWAESEHWSKIASVVLRSGYLQVKKSEKLSSDVEQQDSFPDLMAESENDMNNSPSGSI